MDSPVPGPGGALYILHLVQNVTEYVRMQSSKPRNGSRPQGCGSALSGWRSTSSPARVSCGGCQRALQVKGDNGVAEPYTPFEHDYVAGRF